MPASSDARSKCLTQLYEAAARRLEHQILDRGGGGAGVRFESTCYSFEASAILSTSRGLG